MTELKLHIDPELQAMICRAKSLCMIVDDKEAQAYIEKEDIDYLRFSEYQELHNVNTVIRQKVADEACIAINLTVG